MSITGPDTIRILITTDNHVGYKENDPIRGDDSWKTFDEIMGHARTQDVDMVLQAGDLFHVNKPSKKSLYHVVLSLLQNCYGERPCELALLNDPSEALGQTPLNHLNYEDPNINVSVPVFAISGNHDDSGGDASLCPNDILAATGLINHFGKVPQNDDITVTPLLFSKGSTNLALYGLANVRDERLFRTFSHGIVTFLRPEDDQEWFSLMAVHQNRTAHTETSYLPSDFLPRFLNMVIWGHEHECICEPARCPDRDFDILQVGSSVATSLCDAETKPKYIFVLCITGKDYVLEKIRLKTVRPFVMEDVVLSMLGVPPGRDAWSQIATLLDAKITGMIERANAQWVADNGYTEDDVQGGVSPPLPLIRLRVEYSGGYDVENPRRFSNRYVSRVANIDDVVLFFKKKVRDTTTATSRKGKEKAEGHTSDRQDLDKIQVQNLVESILGDDSLCLLAEIGLGQAVAAFIDKDEKDAIKNFFDKSVKTQLDELMKIKDVDDENLLEHIIATKKKTSGDTGKEVVRPGSVTSLGDGLSKKRPNSSPNYVESVSLARGFAGRGRGRAGFSTSRSLPDRRPVAFRSDSHGPGNFSEPSVTVSITDEAVVERLQPQPDPSRPANRVSQAVDSDEEMCPSVSLSQSVGKGKEPESLSDDSDEGFRFSHPEQAQPLCKSTDLRPVGGRPISVEDFAYPEATPRQLQDLEAPLMVASVEQVMKPQSPPVAPVTNQCVSQEEPHNLCQKTPPLPPPLPPQADDSDDMLIVDSEEENDQSKETRNEKENEGSVYDLSEEFNMLEVNNQLGLEDLASPSPVRAVSRNAVSLEDPEENEENEEDEEHEEPVTVFRKPRTRAARAAAGWLADKSVSSNQRRTRRY
ncbi:Double-strand break repair protein [Yarrowia sp. B02]|nr:Double-strand break repair protein [Yarrowia sp. B02]